MGNFLVAQASKTPDVLPIFLTYNIGTYTGTLQNPGTFTLGDHEPYVAHNITSFYIWSSYMHPPNSRVDVLGLSHEVAEFLHDPFNQNLVRSYPAPGTFLNGLPWNPPYSYKHCSSLLEVGDATADRLALEIPDADRHLDHDVPRSEYSDRVLVHTGQSVVFGERVVHTERRDRRGIWRDGAAVYPSRAVSFAADR